MTCTSTEHCAAAPTGQAPGPPQSFIATQLGHVLSLPLIATLIRPYTSREQLRTGLVRLVSWLARYRSVPVSYWAAVRRRQIVPHGHGRLSGWPESTDDR